MQPIKQLQWTNIKADSENLIISFLENNKVQEFSSYLPFLHRSKDFQSSYITFDIFSNSTFFGTTKNKWKL